jgi:diguanylate cyclase (GGDEF)-like protein
MKLSGVRADPLAAVRRRVALQTASGGGAVARTADSTAFLGLSEADLTPQVQAALAQLFTEIEELRKEVTRMKAHLAEAEALADEDVLTPLANRRAFMRELTRTIAFAQRYGGPAALIYFDLDGFKQVNDRFGHAAGDEALKSVAQRLLAHVRESDIVGRLGGDEFGVILNQADEPTALAKAAQLAAAIEGEPVACGDYMAPLHVTWGVRAVTESATAESLLSEADAAMYASKRAKAEKSVGVRP